MSRPCEVPIFRMAQAKVARGSQAMRDDSQSTVAEGCGEPVGCDRPRRLRTATLRSLSRDLIGRKMKGHRRTTKRGQGAQTKA